MMHGGKRKRWTPQEGLAALATVAKGLGYTPTVRDLGTLKCPSAKFFCKYFGSYTRAQRLAGLEQTRGGRRPTHGRYAKWSPPPIDQAKAATITETKKRFWSGDPTASTWIHPYRRSA